MVEAIATEMVAAFEGSASGVAVTCTAAGEGGSEGAVYAPLEEIVPQAAPERVTGNRLHTAGTDPVSQEPWGIQRNKRSTNVPRLVSKS